MINAFVLKPKEDEGLKALEAVPAEVPAGCVLWVDAQAPTGDEMEALRARFDLDHYSVEDVLHGGQRPKVEEYGTYTFSVVHLPVADGGKFKVSELFVFFSDRWFVTVHPQRSEALDEVRKRLVARGLSPLSKVPSPDLLYYVFLDFAVDMFYPLLDVVEDDLDALEKRIVGTFRARRRRVEKVTSAMAMMGGVKEKLMVLRRTLAPIRDMLGMIMRGAVPHVKDSSLRNFRDVYDHSFQLIETIDAYRDRASDVRDLHISLVAASTGGSRPTGSWRTSGGRASGTSFR